MRRGKNDWILLFIFLVYYKVLIFPYRVANDLHFAFKGELLDKLTLPQTWSSWGAVGFGEYSTSVLWNWPVGIFFSTLAKIGINFNISLAIFGFGIAIFLSVFGISRLLGFYKISGTAKILAILLFTLNTYFILLIDGGQLNLAIAYSILPLAFYYYLCSEEIVNFKIPLFKFLISGLALSMFDFRILYLLAIMIFAYSLSCVFLDFKFINIKRIVKRNLVIGLIFIIILFGFHAYWLLPSFFSKAVTLPQNYERISQLSFLNFATLTHTFYIYQPHWFKNVFGKVTMPQVEFIIFPFFVFLSTIVTKKSKGLVYFLILALISVFLAKGVNPPFSGVYNWLFVNLPGFNLFRDSSKFYFLIAVSYSVLLGFTFNTLFKSKLFKKYILLKKATALFFILVSIYSVRPVLLGKMTGTFSTYSDIENYLHLAGFLEKDSNFGRLVWLPTKQPLGYSSPTHPSLEAIRMISKRPFEIAIVGSYEQLNFIREGKFMGELFDISGIKYISYPYPDIRREDLKKDNIDYYYQFLDQITSLPWVDKRITDPPVPLLVTKKSSDHLFLANSLFYIVGSDNIYNDLIKIPGFELRNNAVVFGEENPGNTDNLLKNSKAIILVDKNLFDLTASLIPDKYYIFPAAQLDFDPNESGWWKRETSDFLSWRVFLQEKYDLDYQEFDYGGGVAVGEGNRELVIISDKIKKGDRLFVRVLNNAKGGGVEIINGGEKSTAMTNGQCFNKIKITLSGYKDIPGQEFLYDCTSYFWMDAGEVKENGKVTIKSMGNLNVINAIVSVPENILSEISNSIPKDKIVLWNKLSQSQKENTFQIDNYPDPTIDFTRLSPTHYKVNVIGVKKPVVLAFSENFDSLWKLNGEHSTEIYSLINGFVVNKDGVYELIYDPQKYVIPGLIISAVTLFMLVSFYVISKKSPVNI